MTRDVDDGFKDRGLETAGVVTMGANFWKYSIQYHYCGEIDARNNEFTPSFLPPPYHIGANGRCERCTHRDGSKGC
jgi:hypothetical protein